MGRKGLARIEAELFYAFLRVRKTSAIAAIKITGAVLTSNAYQHSRFTVANAYV